MPGDASPWGRRRSDEPWRGVCLLFLLMVGMLSEATSSSAQGVRDRPPAPAPSVDDLLDDILPSETVPPAPITDHTGIRRMAEEVRQLRLRREQLRALSALSLFVFPTVARLVLLAPLFIAWMGLLYLHGRQPMLYRRLRIPLWLVAIALALATSLDVSANEPIEARVDLVNRLYELSPAQRAIVLLEEGDVVVALPEGDYEFSQLSPGRRVRRDTVAFHLALADLYRATGDAEKAVRHAARAAERAGRSDASVLEEILAWANRRQTRSVAAAAGAPLIQVYSASATGLISVAERLTSLAPSLAREAVESSIIAGADPSLRLRCAAVLHQAGFSDEANSVLAATLDSLGGRDVDEAASLIRQFGSRSLVPAFTVRALKVRRSLNDALSLVELAAEFGNAEAVDLALGEASARSRSFAQRRAVIEAAIALDRHEAALAEIGEQIVDDRSRIFVPAIRPQLLRPFEQRVIAAGRISLAVLGAQLHEKVGNPSQASAMMVEALEQRLQRAMSDYGDLNGSLAEYSIIYDFAVRAGSRFKSLTSRLERLLRNCGHSPACSGRASQIEASPRADHDGTAPVDLQALRRAHVKERLLTYNLYLLMALRLLVLVGAATLALALAWVDSRRLLRLRLSFLVLRGVENLGWVGVLSIVLLPGGIILALSAQFLAAQIYQCSALRLGGDWRTLQLLRPKEGTSR